MSNAGKQVDDRDIGFTVEEDGTKILETGQVVPRFKITPNNPEAHRKAMAWIERSQEKAK
jgi:hypothetical protein